MKLLSTCAISVAFGLVAGCDGSTSAEPTTYTVTATANPVSRYSNIGFGLAAPVP